jgi:hypothetical protein
MTARGYQLIGRGYSSPVPGAVSVSNARESMAIARAHSFARRVHSQAEAAKLDAAIAVNLEGLGYGE